jgi:hypothetical protein
MKLLIDIPHGWTTTSERDWTTSVSSDRSLRLVVAPLVERVRANVQHVLKRDVPAGARVEELARQWTRAYTGWEMAAIIARTVDASGREIERRRVAVYQVQGLAGAVMMVGTPPRAFERQAEMIDRVLRSGRPQTWTREPTTATEWRQRDAS